jgi:anti-sigma regulatory factor (Ser/Thr protein kinase)
VLEPVAPGRVHGVVTGTLAEDRDTGVWLVTLRGSLTLPATALVTAAVEKCFAHCPAAIVVDLRGLTDADETALTILPTMQRRAALAEVPLVYAGSPDLAERVSGGPARHFLRIHHTVEHGHDSALRQPGRRWLRLRLAPQPLTSSMARDAVGEACLDWRLKQVLHPARVIVGELVDNAVEHARTTVEVTVGVLAGNLHIRVRDESTMLPHRRRVRPRRPEAPLDLRGQGLRLLDQHAAAWGTIRKPDGKVVWATLALPRRCLPHDRLAAPPGGE